MPLRFRKTRIADETYEAAGVFDVNGDGRPDIVSGAWWYEGPEFTRRHWMGAVRAEGEYYDDFSAIPLDVNGDGRPDVITGGWWGHTLRWRENPGTDDAEWPEHVIAECGPIETTRAWDVDGDGVPEIVPNTPGGALVVYKLTGPGTFVAHTLRDAEPQGHGLGFGDVNGDGRGDFVLSRGWLEAPNDPWGGAWTWHPEFDLGRTGVPILVVDVNGDGLNDLIVGQGHDYGLDWWEQRCEGGRRTWVRHPIDPFCSQYHDLHWVDLDGDGAYELVTGKRYRAHCGKDPGADDDVGVYYFKWNGESFSKQVIDHGPPNAANGLGIAAVVADVTGIGRPDIVAPGKDGLVLFRQESG
jgi:hypothetical protein